MSKRRKPSRKAQSKESSQDTPLLRAPEFEPNRRDSAYWETYEEARLLHHLIEEADIDPDICKTFELALPAVTDDFVPKLSRMQEAIDAFAKLPTVKQDIILNGWRFERASGGHARQNAQKQFDEGCTTIYARFTHHKSRGVVGGIDQLVPISSAHTSDVQLFIKLGTTLDAAKNGIRQLLEGIPEKWALTRRG